MQVRLGWSVHLCTYLHTSASVLCWTSLGRAVDDLSTIPYVMRGDSRVTRQGRAEFNNGGRGGGGGGGLGRWLVAV